MILRRSIGDTEMWALLSGDTIQGRFECNKNSQCGLRKKGKYICFFVDDYWWIDNNEHRFCITVDIPEDKLIFGEGIYYAGASMKKTHIWSGKRGNEAYYLKEAYVKSYSIKDIISFAIDDDSYNQETYNHIIEKMKKHNVKIVDMPNKEMKYKKWHSLRVSCAHTGHKTEEQKEVISLLKKKFEGQYGIINFDCFSGYEKNPYFYKDGEKIYYDGKVNFVHIELYGFTKRGGCYHAKDIYCRVNAKNKTIYHNDYYGSIESWQPLKDVC